MVEETFSKVVSSAELTDFRRALHAVPELSGRETRTQAFVAERLGAFGLRPKAIGTGLVADIKGRSRETVALRADMDALPIAEQNDVPYRSRNDGVMHACGHDAHMAILLGAAHRFSVEKPPLTVRLIFQPSEENGGGADMLAERGALDGVRFAYGLHLDPSSERGTVSSCGGVLFAGNCDFRIDWYGESRHVASADGGKDALAAATLAYARACALFADGYAARNRFAICSLHAGSAHNVIADRASMSGTFRCFDPAYREAFFVALSQVLSDVTKETGVEHRFTSIAAYEPLRNDAEIVAAAQRDLGVAAAQPRFTSDDFASFLRCVRGAYFLLGVRDAAHTAPLHSPRFDFDESVLPIGVEFLVSLVGWTARTFG